MFNIFQGSYKAYRQSIGPLKEKLGDIPILPYIGVNLSDLTFTEDGNATFIQEAPASSSSSNHGEQQTSTLSSQIPPKIVGLSEKTIRSIPRQPIVNFSKLRLVSKLMSDVVLQQRGPRYTFVPENKTLEWIYDGWPLLSENDLYTQSKICEPRQPDA